MGEKETMNMNEVKHSAKRVAARPAPLFASSWLALFSLLRSSLLGEPGAASSESAENDAGDSSKH